MGARSSRELQPASTHGVSREVPGQWSAWIRGGITVALERGATASSQVGCRKDSVFPDQCRSASCLPIGRRARRETRSPTRKVRLPPIRSARVGSIAPREGETEGAAQPQGASRVPSRTVGWIETESATRSKRRTGSRATTRIGSPSSKERRGSLEAPRRLPQFRRNPRRLAPAVTGKAVPRVISVSAGALCQRVPRCRPVTDAVASASYQKHMKFERTDRHQSTQTGRRRPGRSPDPARRDASHAASTPARELVRRRLRAPPAA